MSGIYFHIPFCKVKCHYCDFYKSTELSYIGSMMEAFEKELSNRKDYLTDKQLDTIYFGGGTPSVLKEEEIAKLLDLVYANFDVSKEVEITLEANPDDLSQHYLDRLINTGVNRLSIGIQSFSDTDLKFMGRRHSSKQAVQAIQQAQQSGFTNISADLIYGIPGMTFEQWTLNLEKVFDLKIQHLSAYHLTYHEGTPMWNNLRKGVFREADEDESIRQFEALISASGKAGFIHYEISNFALEGYYSRHNSSYWNLKEYLGIGPSAHSFNIMTRYWNTSDIKAYLAAIREGNPTGESEELTLKDRFNDYIITRLRTKWGIDMDYIRDAFGDDLYCHVKAVVQKLLPAGVIEATNSSITIAKKGIFISDKLIEDFFY